MLAGETLELSHVVPTALTDEMVAAIKEVTKENTSVTLRDAVEQGLPDSLVELPTYDRSKLQTGIVHIGLARGDAMGLEAHNVPPPLSCPSSCTCTPLCWMRACTYASFLGRFRSNLTYRCVLCFVQLVYMDSLLRANPEENYKWGYTAIGILPGNAELRDVLQKQVLYDQLRSPRCSKLNTCGSTHRSLPGGTPLALHLPTQLLVLANAELHVHCDFQELEEAA